MQGAGFYLQSNEVVMNSEEQTLEVTFKVAFTGSDATQALAFPVKTLGILNCANPPL